MNIKGKYINNTVIVSLENGEILFKTGVTQDFLGNLYAAESEDEIRVLMENENLVDGLSQEDRKTIKPLLKIINCFWIQESLPTMDKYGKW